MSHVKKASSLKNQDDQIASLVWKLDLRGLRNGNAAPTERWVATVT